MSNPSKYAKLTTDGKLIVTDRGLVDNLNSDMVDGIEENQFLRTDENRTIKEGTTLTNKGKIEVAEAGEINVSSGRIKVGNFILEALSNNGVSLGFK